MTIEANKALFLRCFAVINGADPATLDGAFADDALIHSPGEPGGIHGVEAFKRFVLKLRAGFPDLQTTIDDLVAEGTIVAARISLRGTHRAEYRGIPATGRTIAQTELIMARIVDGRVQAVWQVIDALGVMQQLGLAPMGDPPRLIARLIVGLQRLRGGMRAGS